MAKKPKTQRIVRTAQPLVWTGDALLDRMLELADFRVEDLRHALTRTREGLDAKLPAKRTVAEQLDKFGSVVKLTKIEEGGAPDHATRLRAAEDLLEWLGFRGKRERDSQDTKPVNVTITLTAPEPRAELPAGRLSIHLTGNGHANGGNGHPAD